MNRPIIENEYISLNNLFYFVFNVFRQYLKIILSVIVIFMLYYFFLKTPSYSSEVSFYTNYNESNQSSALSFIRSFAGDRFEKNLYLGFTVSEYLASEKLLQHVVEQKYSIKGDKKTLVDYWGSGYDNVFSINPITTINKINRKINMSGNLSIEEKKLLFAKEILKNSIGHLEDKQSSLNAITVTVRENPELSQEILENIFDSIVKYSNEITNIKAKEKKDFVVGRLSQIKENLENAEDELIFFLESNKNLTNSPNLIVQKKRIEQEVSLYNQLYITLSDQLEIAKIDEKNSTSTVFILDSPHIISYKAGRGFLESIIALFIILFALILVFEAYNKRDQLFIWKDKIMIIWLTGQPGSGKTTLANSIIKSLKQDDEYLKIINLDGDDLRNINRNKDYSKEGRIKNISTAISIIRFLSSKGYLCVVSIVAPYRFLRNELKSEFPFLEVYLHTTEIRGRENFFAKDYEIPLDKHLSIDTGKLGIEECTNEILNVYRKMATLA